MQHPVFEINLELCKFLLKENIFELDVSASQWRKNKIHTMFAGPAGFSSLLLHLLKTRTNAEYCAFDYLSNGIKFITIEEFLEN